MLTGETILVESRLGADRIEVRRGADGVTWLKPHAARPPTEVPGSDLDDFEPNLVFGDAWLGACGLLPDGACRVDVRGPDGAWHAADVGAGAWSVMVRSAPWTDEALLEAVKRGLPVRLLDARGKLVSRVTPELVAASRRVALRQRGMQKLFPTGLPVLCPVCRHGRWRVVAGHGYERIFCGRCGHRHPGGLVS